MPQFAAALGVPSRPTGPFAERVLAMKICQEEGVWFDLLEPYQIEWSLIWYM